jgi:hypothetical protein
MRGTYTKQVSDIWATSTKEIFREKLIRAAEATE